MKVRQDERLPLKLSNSLLLPTCAVAAIVSVIAMVANYPNYFGMNYNSYALLSGLEILVNLGLIVALYKRKGYVQARMWLAILITGNIILGFGELMLRLSPTSHQALMWANFSIIGVVFIPIGFYMFSQYFLGKVSRSRELIIPAVLVLCASVLLTFTIQSNSVGLVQQNAGYWGYTIPVNTQFLLLTFWLGTVVLLGVGGFITSYRLTKSEEQRAQIRIIVCGVLASLIGGLCLDAFPRYFGHHYLPVGVLCQTFVPLSLIYSIYRYETFDVDFAIVGSDILDSLSEAVMIVDHRLKILRVNTAGLALSGYTGQFLAGGSLSRLLLAEDFAKFKTRLAANRNNGITRDVEMTLKTADGKRRTVNVSATELPGSGHSYAITINDISAAKLSYISQQERTKDLEAANAAFRDQQLAMMNLLEDSRDLGEQLAAEKASVEHKVEERTAEVKAERIRLEASINSLNVGFIIIDSDSNIITANKAFKDIVGSKKDNSDPDIHQLALKLGHEYDIHKAVKDCLKHGHRTSKDNLQLDAKVVRIFMAPITADDANHTSLGVVVLVEDITDAKAIERSRDEFFSIASHELRTPLTAIRGNTQMIKEYYKEALADPSLAEMVNDIHDSSIRLITIVNDFLDTSRLEQGKITFQLSNFDVKELVDDVVQEFKAGEVNPDLYIKVAAPKDNLPQVRADRDRLKQTIINLIGNAFKFTEEGGVTINLRHEANKIIIAVSDTGKGIPVRSQSLLFRKFQQASNNILTRDSTRSTGLGLYISRLIAEGMDGKIYLESSEIDKGSTFAIEMPVAADKGVRLAADNHAKDIDGSANIIETKG